MSRSQGYDGRCGITFHSVILFVANTIPSNSITIGCVMLNGDVRNLPLGINKWSQEDTADLNI